MPNIDTTAITGFDAMSAEEKVNALLAYEIPEAVDLTKYVSKETFDKKASEAARLARELKNVPDAAALTAESEKAKADLLASELKAVQLQRENAIFARGIADPEDVKYYVYRIGQLVTDEKTFEQAAEEYFKEHQPKGAARVDLGASLVGGAGQKKTTSDVMNALIRGAK